MLVASAATAEGLAWTKAALSAMHAEAGGLTVAPSLANTSLANTSLANTSLANTSLANTSLANTSLANTSLANTSLGATSLNATSLDGTSLGAGAGTEGAEGVGGEGAEGVVGEGARREVLVALLHADKCGAGGAPKGDALQQKWQGLFPRLHVR